MMKYFVLSFLSTVTFFSFSQKSDIGIYGGGNMYELKNFSDEIDLRPKAGYQLGVNYAFYFKKNVFFRAQVGWVNKGHTILSQGLSSLSDATNEPYGSFDAIVKSNFNYLSSYAAFGYRIFLPNTHFITAEIGASPNYLMSTSSTISTNHPEIKAEMIDLTRVKNWEFSGRFNLAYNFPVNQKLALQLNTSYTKGFSPVFEEGLEQKTKPTHSGVGIHLGLNYTLSAK